MCHQGLVSILILAASVLPANAAVLITAQEAQQTRTQDARPATPSGGGTSGYDKDRGTPTRAPDLIVQSPMGPVASPFPLRVAFTPHNGARIDPNSVTVTLLTKPEVDLTNRVRPYLSARGLDFGQAETPPGQFRIRIELIDDAGHIGATTVDLQVQHP